MKKFLFLLGAFLFCGCFLIACSYSLSSKVKNHISELTDVLFASDGQTFFITLTGGMREEPYVHDGQVATKQPFAVVCVTFFENKTQETLPFSITINNQTTQGQLEKNPFSPNYMVDLEQAITATDAITFELEQTSLVLECKSCAFSTSPSQAIEIAIENLNDPLLAQFSNNTFEAECYLKIINNPFQDKNVFYWYFTVRNSEKTVGTLVIDTMSNNVLAKY